ncbi:nucleoside deaminase [bacterium]|nr:nucleoside deaminase [bacterium]
MDFQSDEYFMQQALREAEQAFALEEVPVGAIVVSGTRIVARSHNLTERLSDATAHAEMQAITAASNALGSKYLQSCTLYVTLEPCVMCSGALYWSQIGRVVFGAYDQKRGYASWKSLELHPRTEVVGGVMAEECAALLQRFFHMRR